MTIMKHASTAIRQWRRSFERDQIAFEHFHGRPPKTLYELAKWLVQFSRMTSARLRF